MRVVVLVALVSGCAWTNNGGGLTASDRRGPVRPVSTEQAQVDAENAELVNAMKRRNDDMIYWVNATAPCPTAGSPAFEATKHGAAFDPAAYAAEGKADAKQAACARTWVTAIGAIDSIADRYEAVRRRVIAQRAQRQADATAERKRVGQAVARGLQVFGDSMAGNPHTNCTTYGNQTDCTTR